MKDIKLLKAWYVKTLKLPIVDPLSLADNEDLALDSLDVTFLCNALERDFGCRIETISQMRKAFSSLSGLANFIDETGDGLQKSEQPQAREHRMHNQYTIASVSMTNAAGVAAVFRAIYGNDFPMQYVYHADQIMSEIREGRLAASLALDTSGTPVGYVSAFKCAPNPRLWEGGNLLVVPDHGKDNLAWLLMRHYLQPEHLPDPFSDGTFGEAVCHHYFTQLGCAKAGFSDCALALDQLDASSFKEHRSDSDRVACLLQFLEYSEPQEPLYLPDRYATILRQLLTPLRARHFLPSLAPLPNAGETERKDDYYESAGTWRISISSIGNDWLGFLDGLLHEARQRQVICLQIVLSTSLPYTGEAVELKRQRGFFLGGIFPRWFGSDGILMQQVLGKEPDYDAIKLYTSVAKELLTFIRDDRKSLRASLK